MTTAKSPTSHGHSRNRISASRWTVALMTLNFSILATVIMFDPDVRPTGSLARAWVVVCIIVDILLAACWIRFRIPASSARAKAFGIWANLGTASVLATFESPADALIGCGILVASGAFFAFYLDYQWLVGHVVFSVLLIAVFTAFALASGEVSVYSAITHADVILVAVVGLPISIRVAFLRAARRARSALLDPLTGLLNRRGLEQLFAGLPTTRSAWACCYVVDIDGFKQINDTFGHTAGDAVLTAVGRCLTDAVDNAGAAARLGGEEFVMVTFPPHPDPARIPLPFQLTLPDLPTITWSVGAVTVPMAKASSPTMWRAIMYADTAMYEAKRNGGARLEVHTLPT